MTSEHYLREIAETLRLGMCAANTSLYEIRELLEEMTQRLARMHELLGDSLPITNNRTAAEWPKELWGNAPGPVVGLATDQASYDWMMAHGWREKV
jgi:hypothetical protein